MRLPGRNTSIVAQDNELEVHSDREHSSSQQDHENSPRSLTLSLSNTSGFPYWFQASRFRTPDVMIPQPLFDAMTCKHVLRLPCLRKATT